MAAQLQNRATGFKHQPFHSLAGFQDQKLNFSVTQVPNLENEDDGINHLIGKKLIPAKCEDKVWHVASTSYDEYLIAK